MSVLCETEISQETYNYSTEGIGIDLGIKSLAVCSNGDTFGNVNKTKKVKSLTKRLKRHQRSLSRKFQAKKKRKEKNKTSANIDKNTLRVQVYHRRLRNIRTEYVRQCVNSLVKANNLPSYVSIEDLNVSGMMKNRHLSKGYPAANVLLLSEVSRREMQEVWSGAARDRPILSFQQDVPQMWHGQKRP